MIRTRAGEQTVSERETIVFRATVTAGLPCTNTCRRVRNRSMIRELAADAIWGDWDRRRRTIP